MGDKISEEDKEAPFEEIYNRYAKSGVIQEKTFTLDEVDRLGRRAHRSHNQELSWMACSHPECEIWQHKFDSIPDREKK